MEFCSWISVLQLQILRSIPDSFIYILQLYWAIILLLLPLISSRDKLII
jgi:hypothetical protein